MSELCFVLVCMCGCVGWGGGGAMVLIFRRHGVGLVKKPLRHMKLVPINKNNHEMQKECRHKIRMSIVGKKLSTSITQRHCNSMV